MKNVIFAALTKPSLVLTAALALQGCVSSGYEGQVGTVVSGDQLSARRDANRSIAVFQTAPSGYQPMGQISARRCHRSFTEEAPNLEAITGDLKVAAYAEGGDAISDITTKQKNGLLANCWYVLEATANVWRKR